MNHLSASPALTGFRRGVRDAFGAPTAVMTAGFIGYGSLASDAGIPFWLSALATVLMWALPGQIILVEMFAAKAGVLAILLAVTMSAARFLPTGLSMLPMTRMPPRAHVRKLLVAQFVATTSWALSMRLFPAMPVAERAPWLVGFGSVCTSIGVAMCGVGYMLAGSVPHELRVGLIFVTPAYFLLLMFADIRSLVMGVSVMAGAIAVPLIHLAMPQWSVPLGGLAGGTAAYLVLRRLRERAA